MKNEEKVDALKSLRNYVVLSFFLLWIGVILVWVDWIPFDYIYTEVVVVSLGFLLFYKFSRSLGFCMLHRLLIGYAYLITFFIWWRRYFGFGEFIDAFRVVCIILGIPLFVWVLIDWICKVKKS